MQFNIIFKTIFEYIHKKFRFVHTNTFCKYRKKTTRIASRASCLYKKINILDTRLLWGISHEEIFENILRLMRFGVYFETKMA